jgi:hypothetical protein
MKMYVEKQSHSRLYQSQKFRGKCGVQTEPIWNLSIFFDQIQKYIIRFFDENNISMYSMGLYI